MSSSNAETNLHLYPLLCGILFPATFAITYTIGISLDHIRVLYSYISDGGAYAPESCIFSLLMCLSGLSMAKVVHIRYLQIQEYFRESNQSRQILLNKLGIVMGLISAFGAAIVGCFQETKIYQMHFTGAALAFFVGALYLLVQAYFTFKMAPIFGSKCLGFLRVFWGVFCLLLFFVCFGHGKLSVGLFEGDDPTNWREEDGGWTYHIMSVVSEWVMAAFFDLYILSFIPEFRKIAIQPQRVLPFKHYYV